MINTRAAVLRDPSGAFSIEEIALEELLPDEVLVRITAAGMCHSDQGGRRAGQFLPAVLGHEGAGVVERTGSAVSDLSTGDHVILSYDACRICDRCQAGAPYHCKHFFELNGVSRVDEHRVKARDSSAAPVASSWFGQSSFAGHAIVKATSAVRVPDDVPLNILSPLGCGFQTGIGSVVNGLRVGQGASIAIFGAGAVGLAAVVGAVLVGAEQIIAIDVVPSRLKLAMDVGATRTIDASRDNWQRELGSWDFTFDTTGVPDLMQLAIQSLAPGGTCGLVGASDELAFNPRILSGRSLTYLVEGHSDPHVFIPRMVEWWRAGKLPVERLVTQYPLDKINDAEQDAASGAVVKPVLIPEHLGPSRWKEDGNAQV